ncbi:hypothetical protein D3C83_267540 [compost metagenome]
MSSTKRPPCENTMADRNSISQLSRAIDSIIGYCDRPADLIFSDCCTTSSQVFGGSLMPAFFSISAS